MSELNEVIDNLGQAFEEFKSANDERLKQIESKGHADPLLEEKVNKANEAISEFEAMKTKLEEVETKLSRKNKVIEGTDDLDQKALDFERVCASNKGVPFHGNMSGADYQDYKKAFNAYLRKGDETPEAMKALSVGSDPDGGYLVDSDMSGRIVTKVFETSPMRQYASQQTIGTDALEGLFDLDEASTGWVGETAGRPNTNTPQLAKWRIPVHELYANPSATQKILDDANISMESWLSGKVAEKMARVENTAFVNGDGSGKPRGFLTYPNGTTIPNTIQQVKSGANGAFATAPNGGDVFMDLVYSMKAPLRNGAVFAMNRSVQAEVRKLKDSDGAYIWQAGLANGNPSSIMGYSIAEFEDMPDLGTGSLSIAFANFAQGYQIVDRAGIRVLRDPYSNKPYVEFYTTKRVGGDVIDFDAIKLIDFSA